MIRPGARSSSVARPAIDHPRADLDAIGRRSERRHRHDGVTHQSAVGLPDGLEALGLGVAHELDPLADVVGVLQVQRNRIRHRPSLAGAGHCAHRPASSGRHL
jgi:hypothetical protein